MFDSPALLWDTRNCVPLGGVNLAPGRAAASRTPRTKTQQFITLTLHLYIYVNQSLAGLTLKNLVEPTPEERRWRVRVPKGRNIGQICDALAVPWRNTQTVVSVGNNVQQQAKQTKTFAAKHRVCRSDKFTVCTAKTLRVCRKIQI